MNVEHSRATPTRIVAALGLLTFIVVASARPGAAQPRPAIGLSAMGARLLVEEGPGHEGPGPADYFGAAVAAGDFNGDGVDDLVTGLPGNDCDFVVWDCGAVVLRLGVAGAGLADTTFRYMQMAGPGNPAFAEYGAVLSAGDFNGDGFADLAVGMPGYGVEHPLQGAVQIHHGEQIGLSFGLQLLREGVSGVPGSASERDAFGSALAVGDFNGDGYEDLAVGAPGDTLARGVVVVAHGSPGGLAPFAGFAMRQGLSGLPGTPENNDRMGEALAAGDFDGDGFDDLAIAQPGENDASGWILIVYGSANSLRFDHWQFFDHASLGVPTRPGSQLGAALAAGDFDGDGFDDLAAAAPTYTNAGASGTYGVVSLIRGSALGLVLQSAVSFSEGLLTGAPLEFNEEFGAALAAGDFDGDGIDDLAIGTPFDNLAEPESLQGVGTVTVVLGGFDDDLPTTFRQLRPVRIEPGAPPVDVAGMIPDHRVGRPTWGWALAAGDFDGNGFADLAIGAPHRDASAELVDTGAVAVLYGQLFADGFEAGDLLEWSGPETLRPDRAPLATTGHHDLWAD